MRGVSKIGQCKAPCSPRPEDASIADFIGYEPETGRFYWKASPGGLMRAGDTAGGVWVSKKKGEMRYVIRFRDRGYQANRVAFLIMTGAWPIGLIDHEDRDTLNNRWANLRRATQQQNAANAKLRKDSTTGFRGVTFKGGKYRARIQVDGRRHQIGGFATAEEAHAAYCVAGRSLVGQFFSGGDS